MRSRARTGRALAVALAVAATWASTTFEAQPSAPGLILRARDGRVIAARLASGSVVELSHGMEVRFAGAGASVHHAVTGLVGRARASDVEVRIARELWTNGGTVGIDPRAHVWLRSVGAREAIVDVRGLSVEVSEASVPLDAITIDPRADAPNAGPVTPDAWARRDTGAPRVLRGQCDLRRTPRGTVIARTLSGGTRVTVVEEASASRVALEDSGLRILGWVDRRALSEPAPSQPASGGGGMGEGRIGLSGCEQAGGLAWSSVGESAPLYRDASSASRVGRLSHGTSLVVLDRPGPRLAILELPGVRRVGRCERPIAWIRRDATAPGRYDPLVE